MELNELLKSTRQYFWDLDFTEVEVNYLQKSLPLEPNLYAYQTDQYYLPMSPEFALKEYLAKYKQNCFSIAHCFRYLEAEGPHHKPEFLMLEYYLVNQNISDLQKSLEKYISKFIQIKIENFKLPDNLPDNEPDFNQFFLNEIEPSLPRDRAVFITGYPAYLSPLAKIHNQRVPNEVGNFSTALNACTSPQAKNLPTSSRFELYINGIEIANGCEENRNSEQIKLSFETEKQFRLQNNFPLHPHSQSFIKNSSLLPPTAGVGIGLDRLLMLINGQSSL